MMNIKQIKGLKYPDEYIIKFFFKESLFTKKGNVLEFGSGNGNNLMLFYSYNYNVTGIDIDSQLISYAIENFSNQKIKENSQNKFSFILEDMRNISETKTSNYDVVLFPSALYYISNSEILDFLDKFSKYSILKKDGFLFFRMRSIDDYRFGKGEKIDENTFKLNIGETGELNCINTFYTQKGFLSMINRYYNFKTFKIMNCKYENYQSGKLINNSDIIFWGQINI